MRPRLLVDAAAALGAAAAVATLAVFVGSHHAGDLGAAALPFAFLVAGALGARARPDHPGLRLLLAVGVLHLVAFALVGWVSTSTSTGWGPWVAAVVGDAAYLGGFVALALAVALSPGGTARTRLQRWFVRLAPTVAVVALVGEVVLRRTVHLAAELDRSELPNPAPHLSTSVSLAPAVFALVVLAVPVLALSARGLDEPERRALGWATITGAVLALLIALSAPGTALLGDAVWGALFDVVVCTVPFLLLAGLVRFRLLRVDLYVVRTLSRGLAVAVVAAVAAVAAATLTAAGAAAVSAAVTVAALLGGGPLLRRLESVADRLTTGGRVGRAAVAEEVTARLVGTDLPAACDALATGLDCAWVRVVENACAAGDREVSVDLPGGGRLECGPRRGGWGPAERQLLLRLAGPVSLALREEMLTRELAARVDELSASRSRIVLAEDTARRRVERDLHDGVQQQLVALLARLTVARAHLPRGHAADPSLAAAHDLAQEALRDLRTLVAGIHPPLLGDRGLVAAVGARAAQLPIEVAVDADPLLGRYAPEVEGAAYFVVLEALANVLKHSGSDRARVVLGARDDGGLRVAVVDAGNGGAAYTGTGLHGLRDRVEALGGTFVLQAVAGVGTTVVAELPARLPAGVRVDA